MTSRPAITEFIESLDLFDAHEHLAGFDWGFATEQDPVKPEHPHKTLPHVLLNDMLGYIAGAALYQGPSLAPADWPFARAGAYWQAIQPLLEELRGAAVYTTIRRGIKELHGFDVDEITDASFDRCNQRIVDVYQAKGQPAWMLEVFAKARVKAVVQMAHLPYLLEYWPSLPAPRRAAEQQVVRPALVLEPFIFSGFEPDRSKARERTMAVLGMHPRNYAEHLAFQHEAVRRHREAGGAALKFICAYQRTLRFENVPDAEASALYAKGPNKLPPDQLLRLQDNLVWHLVRAAKEFSFPIMLHTGYSTPATLGHPENLYNLCRHSEFAEVPFYFAHAGWPHHGPLALMARTFPNVHFGFCWMPALSIALAERLLDEMFDLVPANKLLHGMDCGSVESFYGTAVITKELVAKVLARKVDADHISLRAAQTIARRFFSDNAVNLFGRPEEKAAWHAKAG